MKVLFISHESALNGAPRSMLYLIEDLKNRFNIEPIVLTTQQGPLIEELEKRNIRYIISKYHWWMTGKKGKYDIKYILKVMRFKGTRRFIYKKIYNLQKKYDIDLVHSNTSVCEVGSYIAEKRNIPHVWHIREHGMKDHGIDYIDDIEYVKKQYNKSSKVICVSESVSNTYKNIIDKNKIIVIPNGICIDKYFEKNFNKSEKVRFCTVGMISPGKNQKETLKAIKMLVDKGYDNFEFNIIGSSLGSYKDELLSYINKNNLKDKVIFHGYRNDVNNILKNMDIGIMTSINEAFGRVTVEYMANYMPVIGVNTGGTAEIIKDKLNGFLYELNNIEELASKMEYFINNKDDIERIGKSAYKYVIEKYDMKTNTEKIYDVYKSIM